LRALGLKEPSRPRGPQGQAGRWLRLACSLALVATAPPASTDDVRVVHMRLDAVEHTLGHADAPVTVVEFTDYQCPYCRRFQAETWPRLKHEYIDTGKVRFIVRDLPLPFHADARPAAEAAHCAGEQGRFWPMHDLLLAGTTRLDLASLTRQAQAMGLDAARFRDCVTANKYDSAVARNVAAATALGLRGTPSFILGRMSHGVLEGIPVFGAVPYENFASVINALLAAHERAPG
jgi:protein-disulfide isomerase